MVSDGGLRGGQCDGSGRFEEVAEFLLWRRRERSWGGGILSELGNCLYLWDCCFRWPAVEMRLQGRQKTVAGRGRRRSGRRARTKWKTCTDEAEDEVEDGYGRSRRRGGRRVRTRQKTKRKTGTDEAEDEAGRRLTVGREVMAAGRLLI